jgi:3-hydroxyacyl-CoA dehydrogenase
MSLLGVAGEAVFTTTDTRCWHRDDALIVSLEQPRPTITADVLGALERALDEAGRNFATLVVTSSTDNFAFGATLTDEFEAALNGRPEVLDAALMNYQRVMVRLRHAPVPTVAAVRGTAISGGCELLMHCTAVATHADSRIGLMEPIVGIVPGGGGLKEFALRASRAPDPEQVIVRAFEALTAFTRATPQEAQRFGYLMPRDKVDVADPLAAAIEFGRQLHADGHTPPAANPKLCCVGSRTLAQLRAAQTALRDSGQLTAHQFEINMRMALILCGGDTADPVCTEAQLFAMEREHLIALLPTPLTQARVANLRRTGKSIMN